MSGRYVPRYEVLVMAKLSFFHSALFVHTACAGHATGAASTQIRSASAQVRHVRSRCSACMMHAGTAMGTANDHGGWPLSL